MAKKPEVFDDAVDFELSKSLMSAKSEHRAWTIAKGACALTGLSWLALVMLMPLKTVEPYIVSVDKNSGQTQVVSALNQQTGTITEQEALDRYWLSNYVRWREVYDWYTLQSDYDHTLAFSSPAVQKEYNSLFEGDQALDTVWGKRIKATVHILSIVDEEENKIATVRFEKVIQSVDSTAPGAATTWVATIGYRFLPHKKMAESQRLVNPLAFEVTSYRVDHELAP